MKQLIKSATVFNAVLPPAAELALLLEESPFTEALSLETKAIGFVAREDAGPTVEEFPGGLAFTVRYDEKIIPPSIVRSELAKVCKSIEQAEGRKPGNKERKELKHGVMDDLAQVALVRTKIVTCFYHVASNYLVVPTTSKKLSQAIISALIHAVGSVKTTTINVSIRKGTTERMRRWLEDDDSVAFEPLFPRGEVVLNAEDNQRLTAKMEELESAREGLVEALRRGFTVKSVGFAMDNGVTFKVNDEFQIQAIAIPQGPDGEIEDEPFAAQAAIELAEVHDIVKVLCEMYDYKPEAQE